MLLKRNFCYSGVLSYTQGIDGSSTVPQTNCTLAITISDTGGAEFPLRLLLLLSGIILILVDLGISGLLCVIKYQSCGVLAAAWFLIMVVCTATWTAWSIAFIVVVFPNWLADRALCDNLVMIVTVVMTAFCGLTTLVYVVVIFIVIAFDCHRWRNMKSF